ncbi:MAG: hypothetical protein IKD31_03545 [Clostridia bacterium]|nr:hypothetical protein [Clostridia bacterium]
MKKKELLFIALLLAVLLVLGGAVLHVAGIYRKTGLALIEEREGLFDYNGKFLLNSSSDTAYFFRSIGRAGYEEAEKKSIDLSEFGFEGKTFEYYEYVPENQEAATESTLYAVGAGGEGFWPVCKKSKFVYVAEDGKKYRIHPKEKLCYPMFSDSVEGVDPYGIEVLAFSANGAFAVSLSGKTVTVYHTDPMDDSLRVVDVKSVSLPDWGEDAEFGAFVGNTQAYFILRSGDRYRFAAVDCAEGKSALSLSDPEGEYGSVVSRMFARRWDAPDKKEKKPFAWSHLLLGTERVFYGLENPETAELFAVSPAGNYAVVRLEADEKSSIVICNEKRGVDLSSALQEGEKAESIWFVHENVVAVSVLKADGTHLLRTYKICF